MKLSDVGRAINLFVVEDNNADRRLVAEAFEEVPLAVNVMFSNDGESALQEIAAGHRRPDLILLDISLPRLDGDEVLRRVKADPALKRIPVIVLTGSADVRDIGRMLDLGANSYVSKPANIDGFRALARAIEGFWFATAEVLN